MDPTLLQTFVTVVRLESFSTAARELGYTQSAVSQQVAALESDLGVVLLRRRPVALTEAGARLLEHAGPLLLRLTAARRDVARAAGAASTHHCIGAAPLADLDHLATVIVHMRQSMPRVSYTVPVCGRDAVVSALSSTDIDIGIVDGVAAANDPLRPADRHTTGPIARTRPHRRVPGQHHLRRHRPAGAGESRVRRRRPRHPATGSDSRQGHPR